MWTSPRKDNEHAKVVAEHVAEDCEKLLGRSLTGDELRQVHGEARETVSAWGRRAREVAGES